MRKLSGYHARRNFVGLILLALIAPAGSTNAAQLKEARVTRIIKEVQLLPAQAAPRPAVVNDNVRSGTAVRTGADSRTELTFSDLTLTRLGANTIFSFDQGTRNLDLSSGAVLLQVPKGAGGATITTAAVTAAITGTTVLMEYHRNAYIKLISLEGTARMYMKGRLGESVLVGPGQMLIVNPNAKRLPDPVYVDVKRLVQTCVLITEFGPLPSQMLIAEEIHNQEHDPTLVRTNMIIYGRGTLVSLNDPTNLNSVSQATTGVAIPSGTPSQFGQPITITSPNPYLITSGTTITTEPAITTNGVTDFGKIWRGQAQDGPLSAFIFGSTSTFDTASGFDAEINGQNNTGGAVFKFTSLQLTGNPTISTPTGVINLGLIAINGITSGGPGGILTFAGIRGLLLATQDGSINLGSEISFAGIHDINFYARGVGSNLTLGSAISGGTRIRLWAQGAIRINGDESATNFRAFSGGDFLAGTGTVTATDVSIQSLSNINIDASKFPDVAGGTIELNAADTLNIALKPGGTLTRSSLTGQANTINLQFNSSNAFDLGNAAVSFIAGSGGIQARNVLFANGSSLLLQASGNINIGGTQSGFGDTIFAGGAFSAQSDVSTKTLLAGTSIDIGGSVSARDFIDAGTAINIGGELSALSVLAGTNITAGDITVLNTTGPTSDSDVDISVRNQISITNGVDISRRFAGASLGLNVLLSAGTDLTAGGSFTVNVDNSVSGNLNTGAIIALNAGGNLTINGGGNLSLTVDNSGGGRIGTGGDISLTSNDLTSSGGTANFTVNNSNRGMIASDATINITARNISTSSGLYGVAAFIDNNDHGTIGRGAMIDLNLSGNLTTMGGANFEIFNDNRTAGGGSIAGDAVVDVSASGLSVGGALIPQIQSTGGHIGGNAIVDFELGTSGNISVLNGDTIFQIVSSGDSSGRGTIGSNSLITVNAASISTGGFLLDQINNNGGNVHGIAAVAVGLSGNLMTQGNAFFQILNSGGTIGSDATINVTASSVSVGGGLNASIDNTRGTIGGNATINMSVSNTATVSTDATVQILGNDPAGSAAIDFNGGNYVVASPGSGGMFLSSIAGNGTITFNNASVHADVIKAGAFGNNGVLNIGGGFLTADSILKLYAPGSNGQLNFVANVTLDGISAKILAANSITIFNNVVVTIGDDIPASVYTNHPNYSRQYGGNGSTTGRFAGVGASLPLPLSLAPPFGASGTSRNGRAQSGSVNVQTPSRANVTSTGRVDNTNFRTANRKPAGTALNIGNTDQLLALLDGAAPGSGRKITIPASRTANRSRNPSRDNANALSQADRRTMDVRTVSSIGASRSPQ